MRTTLIFLVFISFIILSFYHGNGKFYHYRKDEVNGVQYSINPPPGRTGAPGEGVCTDCHNGSVLSSEGILNVTISGSGEYMVGQTYSITVESILGGIKNGFEMTILDDDDNQAGTFTPDLNSNVISFSGREYIRHSTSSGMVSWTFDWTAPNEDQGNLWAYFAFNKSNNNANTSGDEIYLGQFKISSAKTNQLSEYEIINNSLNVWHSHESNTIHYEFNSPKSNNIIFLVQDMKGNKIISSQKTTSSHQSHHSCDVVLPYKLNTGFYIASMLNENRIYSRKLFIK